MPAIPLRHELKFIISEEQHFLLRNALEHVLMRDPNGDEQNQYAIRSLYFDTVFDDALRDKLDGVQNRDKYRIRIYNYSDKMIRMECKTKVGTLISKRSQAIPRSLADQLIAGDPTGLETTRSGLLQDVYREMTLKLLRPAVIVDYVREAYIHPAEDVRITFDFRLRSGLRRTDMFNPYVPTVLPFDRDQTILEVKFNKGLPGYLQNLISTYCGNAVQQAVSKYVWCRSFEGFAD